MRIVLDTNVLISAYVFPGGNPEAVYRLVLAGTAELITSRPLLTEFGRVLESEFGWAPARSEDAIRQLARLAVVVKPVDKLSVVAEDPADDRVLEAANAGSAALIVTGDRHLLNLGSFGTARIVTAATFLEVAVASAE